MIYIKSILVGVVALFATTIVYLVILISVLLRRYPPPLGAEVSFDLRSILNHEPSFWLVAFLAFALGFYWEFRRVSG
jgi:H+/Cl- antiporter ClcA